MPSHSQELIAFFQTPQLLDLIFTPRQLKRFWFEESYQILDLHATRPMVLCLKNAMPTHFQVLQVFFKYLHKLDSIFTILQLRVFRLSRIFIDLTLITFLFLFLTVKCLHNLRNPNFFCLAWPVNILTIEKFKMSAFNWVHFTFCYLLPKNLQCLFFNQLVWHLFIPLR